MNVKKIKFIAFGFVVAAIFFYGFLVGAYRIFPYNQISDLREHVKTIVREYRSPELSMSSISILDTSLQRLVFKNYLLNPKAVRGGAIAGLNNHLYVATNENSLAKGEIKVYDLINKKAHVEPLLQVPMNVNDLFNSGIVDLDGFELERFRVSGMYVEEDERGNHVLYVSHNIYNEKERCISFSVSKIVLQFDSENYKPYTEWDTIFSAIPCMYPEKDVLEHVPFSGEMSGGKLVNYNKDTILMSIGDFHRNGINHAALPMDSSSTFGKFILLNKFTGEHEIFAIGTRNAQGLLIDKNKTIWATEHGPRGGDELNIVTYQANLGWPAETWGLNYESNHWPNDWPFSEDQGRHDNYQQPVFGWSRSVGPSNLIQINGAEKFQIWSSDLIVASMVTMSLHRLRIDTDNKVLYNEVINIGKRIRDITTLNDEKIALLTDDGYLYLIDDGGPVYDRDENIIDDRIRHLNAFDNMFLGSHDGGTDMSTHAERIFSASCTSCHSLSNINGIGPHLNGLFDRDVGAVEDYNYSEGLRGITQTWTPALLKQFLLMPDTYFPDNIMQKIPLTESEVDSLIVYLSEF